MLFASSNSKRKIENEEESDNNNKDEIRKSFKTEPISKRFKRAGKDGNNEKNDWEKQPGDRTFNGYGVTL